MSRGNQSVKTRIKERERDVRQPPSDSNHSAQAETGTGQHDPPPVDGGGRT